MAQDSMFWTTNATGDGNDYTQTEWFTFLKQFFQSDNTVEGVITGVLNELACTGVATPIAVNTGAAIVNGAPYFNSASVNVAIASPAVGTTGCRIVLRWDLADQTVRIAEIRSADNTPAFPALTQDANHWEIPLCNFTITTLGVITITDARRMARFADALVASRQGGSATNWSTAGTTNYQPGRYIAQVGSSQYDGMSPTTVTFPIAFTNEPLVIGVAKTSPVSAVIAGIGSITATTFAWEAYDHAGAGVASYLYWIAIGTI